MESNELLASLAKMEASLNEVESARKQVESTVNASLELKKEVREYVSAVKALCVSLQSWESELRTQEGRLSNEYEDAISQVNSTCTEIVSSFGFVVEKASTDLKEKTDNTIDKFTQQNAILTERVKEMNTLKDEIKKASSEIQSVKESLSQISKDLKDSQDSQDAVLNDIKLTLSDIPGIINNNAKNIIEKIESLNQGLKAEIESLQGKTVNLNSELSHVKSLCYDIKAVTNQLHSDLQTSKESLLSVIAQSNEETAKSINVNRWITIAAFIILVIIHFILNT
jgi:chromosome segregation ATPase